MINTIKTVLEVGKYYKSKHNEIFSVLSEDNNNNGMLIVEFTNGELHLATQSSIKKYTEITQEEFLYYKLLTVRGISDSILGM